MTAPTHELQPLPEVRLADGIFRLFQRVADRGS